MASTATGAIRKKEQETGAHLPIVALTAHAMKGDRERCLAAGMDAYLSKPLKAQELFDVLARLVSRAAQPAESSPSVNDNSPEPAFDLEAALARVEGDHELLQTMIGLFTRQSGKLVSEIRQSIADSDGPTLERTAHKLKGSIGNFCAQAPSMLL